MFIKKKIISFDHLAHVILIGLLILSWRQTYFNTCAERETARQSKSYIALCDEFVHFQKMQKIKSKKDKTLKYYFIYLKCFSKYVNLGYLNFQLAHSGVLDEDIRMIQNFLQLARPFQRSLN